MTRGVRYAWAAGLVLLAAGGGTAAAEVAVGSAAPAFTLTDAEGASHSLSEFADKWVVLEWFNRDCPFVRKHYGSGNMQRLQVSYTGRGVAWLTIASSAPGKQGYLTPDDARQVIAEFGTGQTALLLDPDGTVGRRYGAKTTPHMFIIDPQGIVIYAGAIDDRPSVDPANIPGATNYVQQALEAALAGRPVPVAETTSYGCSVKYAD